MARYKVLAPGFFGKGKNAKLYDPNGKRPFLTVDKPFPKGKVPSWLELMKEPTKAQLTVEKKNAATDKKANDEKAATDKIEKDAVTFTESPKKVVTL